MVLHVQIQGPHRLSMTAGVACMTTRDDSSPTARPFLFKDGVCSVR